jgi:molecular chaperone HtpG
MNNSRIRLGKQILDIITAGMYSNPLMVVREYVQNAADSIDAAVARNLLGREDGQIWIDINGSKREISIRDNGLGIARNRAFDVLFSVGASSKNGTDSRGFRGIGRLGGIGYCDEIVFETRASREDPVFVASWNGVLLREICRDTGNDTDLAETIATIVKKAERRATHEDPNHFFCVTMKGVHRFHRDELMNVGIIREYLSHVSPIPFDKKRFPFASVIDKHLSGIDGYRTYKIIVNAQQVYKAHSSSFAISGQSSDEISDVECFEITGREGQQVGRGWFAKSKFKASLLQGECMRGIRMRQGNIEVGDEYSLSDSYAERRFATWAVGEVHLNYCVKLNARRDGFEQSPDYEAFLEQAGLLCKHLSALCRTASKERSKSIHADKYVGAISESVETAALSRGRQRKEAVRRAKEMLTKTEKVHAQDRRLEALREGLSKVEGDTFTLSSILDGRTLRGVDPKALLEEVAERIMDCFSPKATATSLVKAIIAPYVRREVDLKALWN